MTRRPNPFDQTSLEDALRASGCPESFIASTISNYRLFVPLLLARLGEERIYELVSEARQEFGLGQQETAWRSSIRYLTGWAEHVLADYKARRTRTAPPPEQQTTEQQPRLF